MRDIKGFEGLYAVTSCGKVWSYRSKKFLKSYINHKGYHQVTLMKDGKRYQPYVHKLVLEAFVPNPDPEKFDQGNHMDENKDHNYLSNLEWCDCKYNINYGTARARGAEKRQKAVKCIELDVTFASLSEAAQETGLSVSGISQCCRGKLKTCGKYHWEYVK